MHLFVSIFALPTTTDAFSIKKLACIMELHTSKIFAQTFINKLNIQSRKPKRNINKSSKNGGKNSEKMHAQDLCGDYDD